MENSREGETKNNKLFRRRGAGNWEIKRKEDLGTRVGERPVRRACSVHEGSMLMKSRSRQAIGEGVGDIVGTPTLV